MINNKLLIIAVAVSAFIGIGMALPYHKERNLKILPKDISDAKLDSIMRTYNVALGVTCDFCHSPGKTIADGLDFAADINPMKENARKMLLMTIDINTKNFYFDKDVQPVFLNTVNCKTCHRGEAYPVQH